MKLHQLRALDAIARMGGIRAAARQLGLTQPALTKALRELEDDTGLALVVRAAQGAQLTEAGRRLLVRARLVLRQLDEARQELRQLAGEDAGEVSVALSPLLGTRLFPQVLSRFRERYHQVRLRLIEGYPNTTMSAVADGTVDFGLVLLSGGEQASHVQVEPWFSCGHGVRARRGHPLGSEATLDQLLAQEWVVTDRAADGQYALLNRLCAEAGRALPERLIEIPSLAFLRMVVEQSDAVCLAPLLGDAPGEDLLSTIHCPDFATTLRRFGLVRHANIPLLPAAAYLCELLREACVGLDVAGQELF